MARRSSPADTFIERRGPGRHSMDSGHPGHAALADTRPPDTPVGRGLGSAVLAAPRSSSCGARGKSHQLGGVEPDGAEGAWVVTVRLHELGRARPFMSSELELVVVSSGDSPTSKNAGTGQHGRPPRWWWATLRSHRPAGRCPPRPPKGCGAAEGRARSPPHHPPHPPPGHPDLPRHLQRVDEGLPQRVDHRCAAPDGGRPRRHRQVAHPRFPPVAAPSRPSAVAPLGGSTVPTMVYRRPRRRLHRRRPRPVPPRHVGEWHDPGPDAGLGPAAVSAATVCGVRHRYN